MKWTMMRNMVVQETPKITQWPGGMLRFEGGRWWMLLRRGAVWRWSRNGRVGRNSRVGQKMDRSVADGEAELGRHGRVLCCRGAWLRRASSRFREREGPGLF